MSRRRVFGTVLFFVSLTFAGRTLRAYSTGITSFSGSPNTGFQNCNLCHGGGFAPSVTISGPTLVSPGVTNTYTLRIAGGQLSGGGLNVSTDAGSIAVTDPGTQLFGPELTHTQPRPVDGNAEVVWTFNWTAPAGPANARIYGSGNSVNLNGFNSGDRAASTSLLISVGGGVGTPGETSGPAEAPLIVTDYNPGSESVSFSYGNACGATNNNIYFGSLSQVATLGYEGEWCSIGTSGSYSGFNPGLDSYFFLVVGSNQVDEGSYGLNRLPASGQNERAPDVGNQCGKIQNLANRCD